MGKAGRPAKEGPRNAEKLLAFVRAWRCVASTRAVLADRVGLTPKQLRRATETLVAEKKIVVLKSGRRYGGNMRAVCLPGWDPESGGPPRIFGEKVDLPQAWRGA